MRSWWTRPVLYTLSPPSTRSRCSEWVALRSTSSVQHRRRRAQRVHNVLFITPTGIWVDSLPAGQHSRPKFQPASLHAGAWPVLLRPAVSADARVVKPAPRTVRICIWECVKREVNDSLLPLPESLRASASRTASQSAVATGLLLETHSYIQLCISLKTQRVSDACASELFVVLCAASLDVSTVGAVT